MSTQWLYTQVFSHLLKAHQATFYADLGEFIFVISLMVDYGQGERRL